MSADPTTLVAHFLENCCTVGGLARNNREICAEKGGKPTNSIPGKDTNVAASWIWTCSTMHWRVMATFQEMR